MKYKERVIEGRNSERGNIEVVRNDVIKEKKKERRGGGGGGGKEKKGER